ncbi:glycosyltransferase family 2 protein [Bacteroides stercorirosoris]|jgi:GT2 family glycosyltransferase|uniref:glycosyltransferase family 2 protein n=1 Tax=Bacteroides stercorirosoris TaxID=871324 RepID=UPI003521012D
MDVSIIIVNYNTTELTIQTIKSIYEKTHDLLYEIILVDNASSDITILDINEVYPNVKLIRSSGNLGFGRANNLGYKYAIGKYIFLLNPDTILLNNAVKELYDFLEAHIDVAIAGGQLCDAKCCMTHSFQLFFPSILGEINSLFRQKISHLIDEMFVKIISDKKYGYVAYVTGADMMIRRDDIEKFGFFDSDFFMYFEETELCKRYSRFGRKIAFVLSSKIIHLEGKSFEFKENRSRLYIQGRKTYYKKVHTAAYTQIANCIYRITCITGIWGSLLFFNRRKYQEWIQRYNLFLSI